MNSILPLPPSPRSQSVAFFVAVAALALLSACASEETTDPPPPEVSCEITSPADGSHHVEGEEITFAGTGADRAGDPLTGSALVWHASGSGDPLGEGESFTDHLPVGDYTITLTATEDAENTAQDEIEITVDPAVTATITSPAAAGTYDENTPVQFTGSAQQHDGTPLTGASLVWRSSLSGQIGTGESFSALLPEGEQEISLTATDGQGRYARPTVTIDVTGDGVMFNHTGTYSFVSSAAWETGDYFSLPPPMTGFCDIIQTGATMALTFTDGYLSCSPVWICAFTGTGSGLDYHLGNSGHIGDLPNDYLTNALTVQSLSANALDIEQLSVYENERGGVLSSSMGFRMTLTKIP